MRHTSRVRPHLVCHALALGRVDEVEVDRGLLVLVADGGHQEPFGRASHRDVEETGLVVADRRLGCAVVDRSTREHVDEVLGPENGPSQPQVGPHALLHTGDDDDAPLPASGVLRGEQ